VGLCAGLLCGQAPSPARSPAASRPPRLPRRSARGHGTGEKKQRRCGQLVREGESGGAELREDSFSREFCARYRLDLFLFCY
jgi:hypothetical protein